jgi:ankyrin repeat protein
MLRRHKLSMYYIGRLKAVMYLVAYGANVNVSGKLSGPLHAAIEGDHADIVDFLLSQPGLDINAQTLRDRQSALHVASEQGNTRLVSLLLRHGARLDVKDWRGRLPADVSKNVEVSEHCRLMAFEANDELYICLTSD